MDQSVESSDPILSNSKHSTEFYRFKQKLEEFRLTVSSIEFLDKSDIHVKEQLLLTRKVTAAMVQYEQGMAQNALNNFTSLYYKAKQLESLFLQKEIASRIKRIYQCLQDQNNVLQWNKEIHSIDKIEETFRSLADQFNQQAFSKICCDHHISLPHMSDYFAFQRAYKRTGLIKIKWMQNFVRALSYRSEGNHYKCQKIAWKLLDIFHQHQNKFSRQYYLTLMQLILENMYFLNKTYVVRKASTYADKLDSFPIYQSFPLISLNLYELFRQGNGERMMNEIIKLESRVDISNYHHIQQHLIAAKAHSFFLLNDYRGCLILINRNVHLKALTCCRQQSDLKVLEMICLFECNKINLLFEKLEAFRKFIERRKGEDLSMYKKLYHLFKELTFYSHSAKYQKIMLELMNTKNTVYGYQIVGTKHWLKTRS